VGTWRGSGQLADITADSADSGGADPVVPVGLQIAFEHDGRDFLRYELRAWHSVTTDGSGLVNPQDGPVAAIREAGFWRRGFNQDAVEIAIADSAGAILTLTGVAGDARWELATDSAATTPTGRAVRAERRLYVVVRDALMIITEQKVGQMWRPHLNAQLFRTH
jgi:hypothetical protein